MYTKIRMKFYAIYRAPQAVIDEWLKKPEAERKVEEQKMMVEWQEWAKKHSAMIKESAGLGKTKQITSGGTAEVKNDLMMYTIVEADSAEAAAAIFEGHPHLVIPQATIDVMPANSMPGM